MLVVDGRWWASHLLVRLYQFIGDLDNPTAVSC